MNKDIEKQIIVQNLQLNEGLIVSQDRKQSLSIAKTILQNQETELNELEHDMNSLFHSMNLNEEDLSDYNEENLLTDEERYAVLKKIKKFEEIKTITYESRDQYQKAIDDYLVEAGIDMNEDPILQVYSNEELLRVLHDYEAKLGKLSWDKSDFIVIGFVSIAAILIDLFFISIPKNMNFLGKEYKGSPITQKLKSLTTEWYNNDKSEIGKWIKKLEEYAKVPYDISTNSKEKGIYIPGIRPALHRLMEPGHDPILGFIVGVSDILRGTCTVIDSNGVLQVILNGPGSYDFFSAFLKVFAHLLSDIFTSTGLPCPFLPLLQLCTGKSPFILNKQGKRVSYNDVVRFMFANGYDMRHFMTMSIETIFIELSIRTYYNLCYYESILDRENDVRHSLKKQNMLLVAHSIAVSGNVVKTWLSGWNPTAFNYSEFLGLIISVVRTIKANNNYKNELNEYIMKSWEDILTNMY